MNSFWNHQPPSSLLTSNDLTCKFISCNSCRFWIDSFDLKMTIIWPFKPHFKSPSSIWPVTWFEGHLRSLEVMKWLESEIISFKPFFWTIQSLNFGHNYLEFGIIPNKYDPVWGGTIIRFCWYEIASFRL